MGRQLVLVSAIATMAAAQSWAAQWPPAVERSPVVHERLEAAFFAAGANHKPRTQYWDGDEPRYVNRLIEEPSPYLRQHAHNPVDWHNWSEETLAKARMQNKLIFLSVGYATCHWCHVMEEESFDDEETASILNAGFISIKIDREQSPDLDHLFMMASQLQNGAGGWPNSLWLTPDGRPFHTGTYFPKDLFGQISRNIAQAWQDVEGRAEIEHVAEALAKAVRHVTQIRNAQGAPVTGEVYAQVTQTLAQMHNDLEGGFSSAQQFPREGFLLFLLDHWRRTGNGQALEMVVSTLDAIAAGGIHDHVGGGFHRYTVDPNWRTPHFEKMLYNQARLARVFLEAWAVTGKAGYRRAAERALDYVVRDMTDSSGAFYSAEDADSANDHGELVEGAFYVFDRDQVEALGLGDQAAVLGLLETATVEAGAVVHLDPFGDQDFQALDQALKTLWEVRSHRPRPLRDDKIIAGWNGLMIQAFAAAAMALENPVYAQIAADAGDSVWRRLWRSDTGLFRFAVGDAAKDKAALDDYAWLGLGYIALFDAKGDTVWLERSQELAGMMLAQFGDGTGRLKFSADDGPLGPIYDNEDSALPAGESSALAFLAALAARTDDIEVENRAIALQNALSGEIAAGPMARTEALAAFRDLQMGESRPWRSASKGRVHLTLREDRLDFRVAQGWHINAHEPGNEWLIGAALEGGEAKWPLGKALEAGFADNPIRVYDEQFSVPITGPFADELKLKIQVCSTSICLATSIETFRRYPRP